MWDEFNPMVSIIAVFTHAAADECAKHIAAIISDDNRKAILEYAAYRKVIKKPPMAVLNSSAKAFEAAALDAGFKFVIPQMASLTMEKLFIDHLWPQLSPQESRQLLLKAKELL